MNEKMKEALIRPLVINGFLSCGCTDPFEPRWLDIDGRDLSKEVCCWLGIPYPGDKVSRWEVEVNEDFEEDKKVRVRLTLEFLGQDL